MKIFCKKKFANKEITKFLIPIAIVIAGLLIAGGLYQVGKNRVSEALSPEDAAERAVNFITNVALQGQAVVSLLDVTEESGLYKIHIEIDNQEYNSYVTKDGKLLFPQGTELPEKSEEKDSSPSTSGEYPKTNTPKVELFVMSYCPYGSQAEELMMPVDKLLGGKADIKLHYVIYDNYRGGGPEYCLDKENKYCSMHGIQELNQDVRELCIQKYQKDKLWDFIEAVNDGCNSQNVDSCWEGIAKKAGVDVQKVKTCQKNEASELLAQEVALNEKYNIGGSPTLIINETEYRGSRTSEAYKKGVCSAFNSAPDECSDALSSEGGSASGECE